MNDIWHKQIHVKNPSEYVKSSKKDIHNPFSSISDMIFTNLIFIEYFVSGAVLGTADTKTNNIVPTFIEFKLAGQCSVLSAMTVEIKGTIGAYVGEHLIQD